MDNPPPDKVSFKKIEVFDENIGVGAYGSVHKAMCDDLPCAAKKIHGVLVETAEVSPTAGGHRIPIRRFKAEFGLLQQLRHPNIIQYLGMYEDPNTRLPVLLMELMDESLTHYLENSSQSIPYHTQVNICLDITRALSHLHVNGIVHRDLSSNNILLSGKPCKAKLSDFGMAKFLDAKTTMSRYSDTSVPGTDRYMPPEAFEKDDQFKEKGDVFSFGVVIVQILTRKFPTPSARFRDVVIANDSRKLKEWLSEIERRESHLQLIQQDHPLLPMALESLSDNEADRPDASDLCNRLAALTDSAPYIESKAADEKPVRSVEDKCIATECGVEEKCIGTEYDPQCEYVFLAPDSASEERIQHLEQALSEEKDLTFLKNAELKAVKDQLEVKLAVLDKLSLSNDSLLSNQEQLEKQLQEKEKVLENLSQEKQNLIHSQSEMKEKLENQIQEKSELASTQQQRLIEKDQQLDEQRTKISEQNQTIKEHVELEDKQQTQLDEQTKEIAQQKERIDDLESEVSSLAPASKKKKDPKQSKAPMDASANGSGAQSKQSQGFRFSLFKSKNSQPPANKGDADSKQKEFGGNHSQKIASDIPSVGLASGSKLDVNPLGDQAINSLEPAQSTQTTTSDLSLREKATKVKVKIPTRNSENILKETPQKNAAVAEVLQHQGNDERAGKHDNLSSTAEKEQTKKPVPSVPPKLEPQSQKEQPEKPVPNAPPKPEPQAQATTQESGGFFSRWFSKKDTIPPPATPEKTPSRQASTKKAATKDKKDTIPPPATPETTPSRQASTKKAANNGKDKATPAKVTSNHKRDSWRNPFDDDDGSFGTSRSQHQSQELEERSQRAIKEMEASSARSVRTLNDAYRIGVDTTVELGRQSEGLNRIEARLDETHAAVSKKKPDRPVSRRKPDSPLTVSSRSQQQSQELEERSQRAIEKMEASSARSLRTATDAYRIGVDTTVELGRQSEGLDRIEARLDETHATVSKNQKKKPERKSSWFSSKKREPAKPSSEPVRPSAASGNRSSLTLSQLPSTGSTVVDRNLDELDAVLQNMKSIGVAMGDALDQQTDQVGRIQEKTKRNGIAFVTAGRDLKRQL